VAQGTGAADSGGAIRQAAGQTAGPPGGGDDPRLDQVARLEAAARERLDPAAYAYYAAGSGEEISVGEAAAAWRSWRLLPRVLRDVSHVDTSLSLAGTPLASPVLAGPTALHAMADPQGEPATARGVAAAGSLLVLSSRSSRPIEQVAEVAGPWWYQVYCLRDREVTGEQVRRAARAGARALVLTVDAPYVAPKPRVRDPLPLGAHGDEALANFPGARALEREQDPSIDAGVIGQLARQSGLPVLVKGVLRADDAVRCVQAGAAGVIVSNHGGRQLDRAVASAHALPAVAEAVGDRVPVLVDGGIRTGTDVLVALALGARAVLLGRPVLWALAVGGSDGVGALLESYRAQLSMAMALAGAANLAQVTADLVAGRGPGLG
jgi:4-hydroxymandelate oxidase